MQIEKKVVDKDTGLVQYTTTDERWYGHPETGEYVPSVSWIASYYPKDRHFIDWYADQGKEQANAFKNERAEHGSRVHKLIEMLLEGETIKHDTKLAYGGIMKEISAEEYESVISFADWWKTLDNPKVLVSEEVTHCGKTAGTVDLVIEVNGEKWMIDLKTSKNIYPSHKIQLSAYMNGTFIKKDLQKVKADRAFILQVGYKRNKNRYKLTEIKDVDDWYRIFEGCYNVWQMEVSQKTPHQITLPTEVSL